MIRQQAVTQPLGGTYDSWGLDRIDQRALPLTNSYSYTATGAGVHAYVIDSEIWTARPDLAGRADVVYDSHGENGCHHGTHVAGTIGGTRSGVAKKASLHSVAVLNCLGEGSISTVVAGIDWVTANARKPAVANLSLGYFYSLSTNNAVNRLADSGVFVAAAAGNSNANTCWVSPASASKIVAVAASGANDAKASFSNHGSCVDIYAPGVGITSSYYVGTPDPYTSMNGTSMASPHVAGVAALYESKNGDVPTATLNSWITGQATPGVITGNPSGTPNRLLSTGGL